MNRFTAWLRGSFLKTQVIESRPTCKWLNLTLFEPDEEHEEALFGVSFYCNHQGNLKPVRPIKCRDCPNFEAEAELE